MKHKRKLLYVSEKSIIQNQRVQKMFFNNKPKKKLNSYKKNNMRLKITLKKLKI